MGKMITLSYTNNFKPISDNKSQSLRIHCVSVRLNKEELELLNASRGDKRKGEWLRMASLQKLPPAIPAILSGKDLLPADYLIQIIPSTPYYI